MGNQHSDTALLKHNTRLNSLGRTARDEVEATTTTVVVANHQTICGNKRKSRDYDNTDDPMLHTAPMVVDQEDSESPELETQQQQTTTTPAYYSPPLSPTEREP